MEFISNEAEVDGSPLGFFDDDEEKETDELDDFINNSTVPEDDVSFYRQFDPARMDNYPRFSGQIRDPI